MAGKGKLSGKGKSSGKTGTTNTNVSKSFRSGIQFPIGRIGKYLKKGRYAPRIGQGAPIYLAAVLEYLSAEILELAGNAAKDHKRKTIAPRHICLALKNDEELNKLIQGVIVSEGGVMPNIHEKLLQSVKEKGEKVEVESTK